MELTTAKRRRLIIWLLHFTLVLLDKFVSVLLVSHSGRVVNLAWIKVWSGLFDMQQLIFSKTFREKFLLSIWLSKMNFVSQRKHSLLVFICSDQCSPILLSSFYLYKSTWSRREKSNVFIQMSCTWAKMKSFTIVNRLLLGPLYLVKNIRVLKGTKTVISLELLLVQNSFRNMTLLWLLRSK